MPDEIKDDKEKEKKIDALREIQNRIMSIEAELKSFKGAENDNIKAIAKAEIKTLEDEIAALKLSFKPKAVEKGFFDDLFTWGE